MPSFSQWLESHDQRRTVLLEVDYLQDGKEGTLYLSNRPYTSYPSDSPSNQPYEDVILTGLKYSRNIAGVAGGEFRTQVTSVQLAATPEIAEARSFEYSAKAVRVYLGDERWKRNDFVLIAKLTGVALSELSRDSYQLDLLTASVDVDQQVNTGVVSSGVNKDQTLPVLIGDCLNVSPVKADEEGKVWKLNDSTSEIGEVRVDNVPVAVNKNNSTSTITFSSLPSGAVTVDAKSSSDTSLKTMLRTLLDRLGAVRDEASIDSLPDVSVGYYSPRSTTYRRVFDDLLASVGAFWGFNRLGVFTVGVIKLPTGTASAFLTPDDIALDGVRFVRRIQPAKEVALIYDKNFSQQTEKPEEGKTLRDFNFGLEAKYPDATIRETSTLIRGVSSGTIELERRRLFLEAPRLIYKVSAFGVPFAFNLGDEVTIQYPHFNFKSGLNGIVIQINDSPLTGETSIEVLING